MNRISFWAPDHARTATQLQTDVAHAKAGRKANPAAMNVQRNWRCAVKGCYLLLPAAPMPQQYSRLALAVRCDETAPGKVLRGRMMQMVSRCKRGEIDSDSDSGSKI